MTRYEQGFLTKCAEYGVPEEVAGKMLKAAQTAPAIRPNNVAKLKDSGKLIATDAIDPSGARQERMVTAVGPYIDAAAPNGDIHKPISAPAMSAVTRDMKSYRKPAVELPQAVGNYMLQRYIDSLPDPGPNVRNPTAYEAGQFFEKLTDKDKNPEYLKRLQAAFPMLNAGSEEGKPLATAFRSFGTPAVYHAALTADPKLQDEALRRSWHSATSAVPIRAVSPTPVR